MLSCARCGQPRTDHSSTAPHGLPELAPPLSGITCEGYQAASPCTNPSDTGAPGTSDQELHDEQAPHGRAETGCTGHEGDPKRGSFGGGGASGGW